MGINHVQLMKFMTKKKEKKTLGSLLHKMAADTMCQTHWTSFPPVCSSLRTNFLQVSKGSRTGDTAGCGHFFGIVRRSQASEANEGRKIKS